MEALGNVIAGDGNDAVTLSESYAGDIALTPDGLRYLGMIRPAPRSALPVVSCNSFTEMDPERHAVA